MPIYYLDLQETFHPKRKIPGKVIKDFSDNFFERYVVSSIRAYPGTHQYFVRTSLPMEDFAKIVDDCLAEYELPSEFFVLNTTQRLGVVSQEAEVWLETEGHEDRRENVLSRMPDLIEDIVGRNSQRKQLIDAYKALTLHTALQAREGRLPIGYLNVLLFGPPGAGKKYLAEAYLRHVSLQEPKRSYVRVDSSSAEKHMAYGGIGSYLGEVETGARNHGLFGLIDILPFIEGSDEMPSVMRDLQDSLTVTPTWPLVVATASLRDQKDEKAMLAYMRLRFPALDEFFPYQIYLPAPTISHMVGVFGKMTEQAGLVCDEGVLGAVKTYLVEAERAPGFESMTTVVNLFNQAFRELSVASWGEINEQKGAPIHFKVEHIPVFGKAVVMSAPDSGQVKSNLLNLMPKIDAAVSRKLTQ